MDYVTITTAANASDFGNLTVARIAAMGGGSSTRGEFGGGYTPSNQDVIDYITIASTADAQDFGDLTLARQYPIPGGSSTRLVWGPGWPGGSYSNVIDYDTIAYNALPLLLCDLLAFAFLLVF